MKIFISIVAGIVAAIFTAPLFANPIFETQYLRIELDDRGSITSLLELKNNTEYLSNDQPAPLITIRVAGDLERPRTLKYTPKDKSIMLHFPKNDVRITVLVEAKSTHVSFELVSIIPNEKVELIIWGPYPTVIREIIGETVGVVRGQKFALGIQALNVKTLGGYPSSESDVMPSYNIFAGSDYIDIDAKDKEEQLFRGETAKPTDFGSVIQAYCRNRNKDRIIENWDHEYYVAPAYDDSGVVGSKIALFGCPAELALETIAKIENEEGLPHPILDGKWGKISETATDSYFIMDFAEDNIEVLIDYTKKAGLKYLYHGGPFETWGTFKLKKHFFPDGKISLRRCVQKAEKEGIHLGIHTLSNFITPNDPYVSPVPDERLALVGTSVLMEDIDEESTEIVIEKPEFFAQMKNNSLHAVKIGQEIIRYNTVSETQPWQLVDCVRGTFGTTAAKHMAGEEVGKLMDHAYKVFLSDIQLQDEIAFNIADLFNETGLKQISFDGLEGCWSTGMGQYARTLFVKKWYDHLSDDLRGTVITDASNPGHYFWHIYTRMNWGEPWYAGFRESQTQYRLKNQEFFRRNLMPAMLGWFKMTAETSSEDIEWLLARAAGFHAGFSLVANLNVLKTNARTDEILSIIKEWETARHAHAFTEEQKKRMQDVKSEFHLEKSGGDEWLLYPQHVSTGNRHKKMEKQPGEPTYTAFDFTNPYQVQGLQFALRVESQASDTRVIDMSLEIDNFKKIEIPVGLHRNQHLKYSGGEQIILYDSHWNILDKIKINPKMLQISTGSHSVNVDCNFAGSSDAQVIIEFRTVGVPESVKKS